MRDDGVGDVLHTAESKVVEAVGGIEAVAGGATESEAEIGAA